MLASKTIFRLSFVTANVFLITAIPSKMIMTSVHEQNKPDLQFAGDLVLNLVDKQAALTPDAIHPEYPVSALACGEGYRKISYRDFALAVNSAGR